MKRSTNFILSAFIFGSSLMAQDLKLVQKEIVYKTIDGVSLKADLFYLAGEQKKKIHPAIAFFHGGGWAYGTPSEFHEACVRYAEKGFITFSFQYRLSVNEDGTVPHPSITPVECVKDARSALRWIRKHAADYHVDPNKIVACGQSAGGQLALSTALIEDVNEATDDKTLSPVPDAIILYSATPNTMEAWADRLLGDRRSEIWSISPHHNLTPELPPTLAFHGEEDCTVLIWMVRYFEAKALELNIDYELVTYEGRGHYLGDGDDRYGRYYDEEIFERTDAFLVEQGFMDPDAN